MSRVFYRRKGKGRKRRISSPFFHSKMISSSSSVFFSSAVDPSTFSRFPVVSFPPRILRQRIPPWPATMMTTTTTALPWPWHSRKLSPVAISSQASSPPCYHCPANISKPNPSSRSTFLFPLLSRILEAAKKMSLFVAALFVAVGYLVSALPNPAWAASGGRIGGQAFSSRGRSRSSSSSSPSSSSGFRHRRHVGPNYYFSAPFSAPSPFFFARPGYSLGIGGGTSLFFITLGFLSVALASGFLSNRSEGGLLTASSQKTSVLKLQVGLLGMARSLQQDLDHLAARADTSSPKGLHFVLTETVLSLLRHPDYCISGYSLSETKRVTEMGEQRFNELSLEERGKFDEETLVNVGNFQRSSSARGRSSGFNNEYIVVTVLVAAEGEYNLPTINKNSDLKVALSKLGSIPSDRIEAVEVLWTPQDEDDTLSERELLRKYPLLRPL